MEHSIKRLQTLLEKWEVMLDFLTPVTEFRTQTWADCNVAELAADDIIQCERKGYFRVDTPVSTKRQPAVLFKLSTGKA